MATILRRNLISVTEGPVTLLDASYHSQHPDRVVYISQKQQILIRSRSTRRGVLLTVSA